MKISYRFALLKLIAKTIHPSYIYNDKSLRVDEKLLLDATHVAKENKVFPAFYEGLSREKGLDTGSVFPIEMKKLADYYYTKLNAYRKALCEISEMAEEKCLRFMVVKSIKPFTYVGDDVDLLVPSDEEYKLFAEGMESVGYRCVGSGPPESAFRKRFQDLHVMVDVHREMSASYIPYIDKRHIWARRLKRRFGVCDVHVPSSYDEFLILSGHAVFKEFNLNLADFIQASLLVETIDENKLYEIAKEEGVELGLSIFHEIIKYLHLLFYDIELDNRFMKSGGFLERLSVTLQRDIFVNSSILPCHFHISVPILSYFDMAFSRIGRRYGDKPLNSFFNFIRAPFTNIYGLRVLLNYLKKSLTRF